MKFSDLAGNTKATNAVFFLSLINILVYLFMRNYEAVVGFIIFGMLAAYFSQNLLVILGVPLVVVNGIYMLRHRGGMEGMTNNKNPPNTQAGQDQTKDAEEKKNAKVDPEPTSSSESFSTNKKKSSSGHKVDYASSLTEQYNALNDVLGSDAMKNMTRDSMELVKQQKELTQAIEGLGPVVEKLMPMMNSMGKFMNGSSPGAASMEQLSSIMKNMQAKK
jgi:hypothetical protein